MQTLKPSYPEIDAADLKAAREFLTAFRETPAEAPRRKPTGTSRGAVQVHHGITRARGHSASAKSGS